MTPMLLRGTLARIYACKVWSPYVISSSSTIWAHRYNLTGARIIKIACLMKLHKQIIKKSSSTQGPTKSAIPDLVKSPVSVGGGLAAVIYIDVVQVGIMLIGSSFLLFMGLKEVGGWSSLQEKYAFLPVANYMKVLQVCIYKSLVLVS